MASWAPECSDSPETFLALARKAQATFNARFWFAAGGYLYDVIDGEKGNDASLRPNQIFSLSLRFPILAEQFWRPMVDSVTEKLLTPVGLRTLAPEHPDYKPTYNGNLRSRDAAYHQGTVWPWLIGHFLAAWRRVYSDQTQASAMLQGLKAHLTDAGIGTISEIYDAESPHPARGCIAQAWSVAETLRCLLEIEQGADRGTSDT